MHLTTVTNQSSQFTMNYKPLFKYILQYKERLKSHAETFRFLNFSLTLQNMHDKLLVVIKMNSMLFVTDRVQMQVLHVFCVSELL